MVTDGAAEPAAPTQADVVYVLETERLALRWFAPDDAEFVLELTGDPDWIRYIGDRGLRTVEDARGYIETGPRAMYARHGFGLYAVERKEDRAPVGMCGLIRRDWLPDVDVGFAFLRAFRGRGYAHEAALGTLRYARDVLGLPRVAAIVTPENADSIRLLAKLGMGFEGTTRPPNGTGEVAVYGVTFESS